MFRSDSKLLILKINLCQSQVVQSDVGPMGVYWCSTLAHSNIYSPWRAIFQQTNYQQMSNISAGRCPHVVINFLESLNSSISTMSIVFLWLLSTNCYCYPTRLYKETFALVESLKSSDIDRHLYQTVYSYGSSSATIQQTTICIFEK